MSAWEQKCWGEVQHCFVSEDVAVSILKVKTGTRCSLHWHRFRDNQFCVISGGILIQEFMLINHGVRKYNEVCLFTGQTYRVPAGRMHRFVVTQTGTVVETYWAARPGAVVSIDDIVRLDVGGIADESDIRRLTPEEID